MGIDRELWDEGPATGIAIVDKDHQELVRLYSDLVDTIDRDLGKQALLETLERLRASVASHFAHEEAVMTRLGFDDALLHKQDHDRFVQDLEDFRLNVEETYRVEDWPAIAKYLKYRFVQHGENYDNRLLLRRGSGGNA
jgi:hemerythrin-like metal-binding protein